MTDSEKQFQQVGQKIKAEVAEKQEQQELTKQEVKSQLATLQENKELQQLYTENAEIGAGNLSGELPLLKVHAVGRSHNELSDGSEPSDGYFFYKPTGEQFETVTVHILTISRGFRARGMDENKKDELKWNQIMAGLMQRDGDYIPFFLYFTGSRLAKLWEFGKQARKYTRAKPIPIPLFVLTVKLTTEKVKNDYGSSWLINFSIIKAEESTQPLIVLNPGIVQFLKDSVVSAEETISGIITAKEIVPEVTEITKEPIGVDQEEAVDNIPF